jgi:hypothetical protein
MDCETLSLDCCEDVGVDLVGCKAVCSWRRLLTFGRNGNYLQEHTASHS